jgi:hypothetical protein
MFKRIWDWFKGLFQPPTVEEEDPYMQAVLSEYVRSGQTIMLKVDNDGTATMTKYPKTGECDGSDTSSEHCDN